MAGFVASPRVSPTPGSSAGEGSLPDTTTVGKMSCLVTDVLATSRLPSGLGVSLSLWSEADH